MVNGRPFFAGFVFPCICLFLCAAGLSAESAAAVSAPAEQIRGESRPLPDRPLRQRRFAVPQRFAWHGTDEPVLEIEGTHRELTQYYIRQYSTKGGLDWLKTVMDRGELYLGFIRREIEARGLPPELIYLPVIESAYLSTAVSKSGAVGLWQFMTNSIAPFDIHVTDWMDERKDFWKATQGALAKLEENYNYFGDWALALAAYNAGLGAVKRACDQNGTKDYWVLCEKKALRTETIQYVPKFLAAAHVLSRAGRYGLDLGWHEDVEWTRIPAGKSVDLGLLAKEAGIDEHALKAANRELHYGVTPPSGNYHLKARAEESEALRAVLENPETTLLRYYIHTIRSGDTLSAVGRHYGVSADQILQSNPGIQPRFLRIGDRIMVPALIDTGPYEPVKTRDQSLVFEGNHLVKRGETLWSIALAYDIDPEILAEANGMNLSDTLREGRSLKTPIK
ncbi:lytic transglycosylase domain-containing protein [Breznakiella homolactica]|uniref:Transglycosylase SLT domain-containing protein n=1 Tax=Breznakiella homolactica TaxID=2798577 RepID=A0A7T7XRM2_9SPIR|nr:lytic transglycosylase domain-containing protein [Breznakiella homolactica]QQO11205.1 transglycosylase SLT domain-containing protein [Breznakiella homolactica]